MSSIPSAPLTPAQIDANLLRLAQLRDFLAHSHSGVQLTATHTQAVVWSINTIEGMLRTLKRGVIWDPRGIGQTVAEQMGSLYALLAEDFGPVVRKRLYDILSAECDDAIELSSQSQYHRNRNRLKEFERPGDFAGRMTPSLDELAALFALFRNLESAGLIEQPGEDMWWREPVDHKRIEDGRIRARTGYVNVLDWVR